MIILDMYEDREVTQQNLDTLRETRGITDIEVISREGVRNDPYSRADVIDRMARFCCKKAASDEPQRMPAGKRIVVPGALPAAMLNPDGLLKSTT